MDNGLKGWSLRDRDGDTQRETETETERRCCGSIARKDGGSNQDGSRKSDKRGPF